MDITAAIHETVADALDEALARHLPKLTLSRPDTAAMLGVSVDQVRRMENDGHLSRLPGTGTAVRITLASVLELAGWPLQSAPIAAPTLVVPEAAA